MRSPVSCCLSATGVRFLGHPAPAGELSLPHGRPTGAARAGPQRGCRVAHEQDCDRAGRPLYPGDGGALPAGDYPPAGTCRFPAASPYGPAGTSHRRGSPSRDVIEGSPRSPITPGRLAAAPRPGSTACLPPVFSSPAAPGWNEGRFGFYPGLRTPQLPATHAEAETGHRALARVLHPRHQPNLQRRLPLELMHPHFARSRWSLP